MNRKLAIAAIDEEVVLGTSHELPGINLLRILQQREGAFLCKSFLILDATRYIDGNKAGLDTEPFDLCPNLV